MADNNTLSFLEQCQEIAEKHGGKLSTALATLMLACQLNVANAQTAPVNPAVSANASSAKSPEHGQWKEIFIRNSELAKVSPEQAKAEKNAWKQIPGMMDGYDEWLENSGNELITKTNAEEQRLQANSTEAIAEEQRLQANSTEAINTSKLADAKGMEAIAEEIKLNNIRLVGKMIELAKNNSTALKSELSDKLRVNQFLLEDPLIGKFSKDIIQGNCPPVSQEHIKSAIAWLNKMKTDDSAPKK